MLTLVLQFLLKERLLSQIPMQTLVYAKVSKNIAYANFSTPNQALVIDQKKVMQ